MKLIHDDAHYKDGAECAYLRDYTGSGAKGGGDRQPRGALMSEINYAQEVRDGIAFYEKHGRDLPNETMIGADGNEYRLLDWEDDRLLTAAGEHIDGEIPARMVVDLLTMDLLRWARDVYRARSAALTVQLDDGEWTEIGSVKDEEHLFVNETEHLHRALMTAIEDAQREPEQGGLITWRRV